MLIENSQVKKLLAYHKKQIRIYRNIIAEPALKKSHTWAKRQLLTHEAFVDYLATMRRARAKPAPELCPSKT